MSLCIFDPSKSTREIFTSMDTYKEIGLRLLLTAGINALAAKILGGSQKHALLVGLGSTVRSDVCHYIEHQIPNVGKYRGISYLFTNPIIAIACSHFLNLPILSSKTLVHSFSPICCTIIANYVLYGE
jgi:hypothetical protein